MILFGSKNFIIYIYIYIYIYISHKDCTESFDTHTLSLFVQIVHRSKQVL